MLNFGHLDSSNDRHLFLHSSEGQKSKIKVSASVVSAEPSFGCKWWSSQHVPTWLLLCKCISDVLLRRTSVHIRCGSYPKGLIFTSLPLSKSHLQAQLHFVVIEIGISAYEFWVLMILFIICNRETVKKASVVNLICFYLKRYSNSLACHK